MRQTKKWLKENRTESAEFIMDRIRRSLIGYYNYYCITDNSPTVDLFRDNIRTLLFMAQSKKPEEVFYMGEICFISKEISTSKTNCESEYIPTSRSY
ncbi:hypothetical protein GCM10008983_05480 [Lentibacillus halophilus]|uniref:Group II intron, maturase-specific domain n=1 Tax=Lentibacillus halophilus TaxID=295065 RepID=A0ABN0Z445_9BACI